MSSLPSKDQAAMAEGASDTLEDDNDYDKLNDEDWQDMPAPLPPSVHPKLSSPSTSPTHGAGTPPTLLLCKSEVATGESSGSQTPVHSKGISDNSLRLRLDDHLRSDQPSSSLLPLAAGLESPPVPDSASSSSSEYSLLNPSIASSIDQSHRGSFTALSTSSDQPSPSLVSLTPSSSDSTVPSPSVDQPLSASPGQEGTMSTSALAGSQNEMQESPSVEETTKESTETVTHPTAVDSAQQHPSLLAIQCEELKDVGTEATHSKLSQTQGTSPSLVSTVVTTTATEELERRREVSVSHAPADKEDESSRAHVRTATSDEIKETVSEGVESSLPSTSVLPQNAGSPEGPSRRKYRTTVEDAQSSSDEEGEFDSSGLRRRWKEPQGSGSSLDAFGQYSMPGALNLELENLGLASHFAAQSREPAPPAEERQCRICLGGPDEVELGRLISPCMCKGSMKYVHIACLNEWRARSPKRESHYKCDTCKYEFSFRRTSFAKYLGHPATLFILTILVFVVAVFAAGFVMKFLMYMFMEEFEVPLDNDQSGLDENKVIQMAEDKIVFRPPDSLRAVFRIDSTHMVFGSLLVSVIGFLQLLVSAVLMGGGGHVFQIGGFGLGGRRRGGRGAQQGEAGISSLVLVLILVFGLFKSLYVTYQFVRRQTRNALAKAETLVLEVH
ncbi:hypothetical protein BGW42_003966 [Actinomortierella wolfii]|nr:hypothetical protein BGW42_003966 [Actinomortierella wolfii]